MKIDIETRDQPAAIAAARDTNVRALVAELVVQEENQLKLGQATAAFREAVSQPGIAEALPGIAEAFDRDFGGIPQAAGRMHRAA
ncbi:antitoxin MazE7 [Streptomyces sp. NPDC018972]|uniref:antitoxin MazE7 n=1 Tax=Streptomyces sp. NPDC018972 TaxID=3365060 RepID=UPI0037B888DB